jgi:hypothetical protein
MRAAMAYFAGAGTIVVAIAAGLGGGLTIANVISPHQQKLEQTKLEQRMSAKPIPPSGETDQSRVQANNTPAGKPQVDPAKAPVPYLAATQAASSGPVTVTPPPQSQNQPQQQATAPAAPARQTSPQPSEAKLANNPPAEPHTVKAQAAPHDQASSDDTNAQARSPEDANAAARDSDLKRLAAEKRKAQRRQQWADRKKAQQQRDAELRDVDVDSNARRDSDRPMVRGNDGPRVVVQQDDDDFGRRSDSDRRGNSDRPFGFPGFNLFGGDRD